MCKCNNKDGQTILTKNVVPNAKAASGGTIYALDFLHYLCHNRRICVNSQYPLSGSVSFNVGEITSIGQSVYAVVINYVGSITFIPYQKCVPTSCCTDKIPCAVSEPIFGSEVFYVFSETTPTVTVDTTGAITVVEPANITDCCTVTNAVNIYTTMTVNTTTPTTASVAAESSAKTK